MAKKRPGDKTGIEWTHFEGYHGDTWNPIAGCSRVSPGCNNCYAFALHDQRYISNRDAARELSATPAMIRAQSTVPGSEHLARVLPFPKQYDLPFSTVQVLDDGRITAPLGTRHPTAYFVNSMSDLFHEDIPVEAVDRIFAVMAMTPRHRYMILTKRPERMLAYMDDEDVVRRIGLQMERLRPNINVALPNPWPLPNVGLGVTAENQEMADQRIPILLSTPAAMRFVSAEPLLEPIEFEETWLYEHAPIGYQHVADDVAVYSVGPYVRGLDWIIVGGESGPRVRPMDDDWAREIRQQCAESLVAFFYKQPSGNRPGGHGPADLESCKAFPMPFAAAPVA